MEVVVFARFRARAGKRDGLVDAMNDVAGPTRAEPGCLDYGAFHSVRDPDEYWIHSRWADLAAFEHHAGLPHTVRFLVRIEPLLDHPLSIGLAEKMW